MATLHIYSKLLQFTLFQGLSKADLEQIVAHTKLGFHKYKKKDIIAKAQSTNNNLFFLIDGTVKVITTSAEAVYTITETVSNPLLFEPQTLFGIKPNFISTYQAQTDCNVIVIGKAEITRMIDQFDIFRLNYINLLSAHIQKQHPLQWHVAQTDTRQRIIQFTMHRCRFQKGEKKINIKMAQLADQLGCHRLDISKALNQLQKDRLIHLYRGGYHILSIEKLQM